MTTLFKPSVCRGHKGQEEYQFQNPTPSMFDTPAVERWLKGRGMLSYQNPAPMAPAKTFTKRYDEARKSWVFTPIAVSEPDIAVPEPDISEPDVTVPEPLLELEPEVQEWEMRNENASSIVSEETTMSEPAEERKVCVLCTELRMRYKIPFPNTGKRAIRNAHEGPCNHCPDTKERVASVLAAREEANKLRNAGRATQQSGRAKPKKTKTAETQTEVNYPSHRAYPGFTPEELQEYLAKERDACIKERMDNDQMSEILAELRREAYQIQTRGRYKGRTMGEILIHNLPDPMDMKKLRAHWEHKAENVRRGYDHMAAKAYWERVWPPVWKENHAQHVLLLADQLAMMKI